MASRLFLTIQCLIFVLIGIFLKNGYLVLLMTWRLNLAITLRFTDEQEAALARVLELTGESTKSKAIIYLIEHAESLLSAERDLLQIRELSEERARINALLSKLGAGD
ncbi:hypothetical protein J3L11_05940 [Shewanella sp. 4t3-1-2LB]|uniref:hypothetical protein n=1 Tax=Shewanella sp. 4t3-1-2LB TaxID=2817682 RepID=UPI001A985FDD|nr:hypothetical protein [Shewanella sp. 4t3-1-2LB]MBO1271190.1 hypothetical protein [Shewanella sp. 4t3-1-2LB]